MKGKKASTAITTPLLLVLALGSIITLLLFTVNSLIPFVWYQRLQTIAIKYMYVIERFGYLTYEESLSLEQELEANGFVLSKVNISCPTERKEYGELLEFKIDYDLVVNGIGINKTIPLNITRYSYSKI